MFISIVAGPQEQDILYRRSSFLTEDLLAGRAFADDNIVVTLNRSSSGLVTHLFVDDDYVIAYEGTILGVAELPGIRRLYQEYGRDLARQLHGVFNLFLWDRAVRQALVTNDRLGLYPYYYSGAVAGVLLISTSMKDITDFPSFPRRCDMTTVRTFARFRYGYGQRTFMAGIQRLPPATRLSWKDGTTDIAHYWNASAFLDRSPRPSQEVIDCFTSVLHDTVAEWLPGRDGIGIMLSGGYDSRSILACLANLGVHGHAFTWDNPEIRETGIAHELAVVSGFDHTYLPYYPDDDQTASLIKEASDLTDYLFPWYHIGRYSAVKRMAQDAKIVFSGQGELIRAEPLPNDYINSYAAAYFHDGHRPQIMMEESLFNLPDEKDDEVVIAPFGSEEGRSELENLTLFLLYEAYRSDFGILAYAESTQVPVTMPYLDSRIIECVLQNPLSIHRLKSWQKNVYVTWKNRRLYHDLIQRLAPALLSVNLDRGYPPNWDMNIMGLFMTGVWGVRRRFAKKPKKTPWPWELFVHSVLSETRTLERPYVNRTNVIMSLQRWPRWSPTEGYALENLARFELWYRRYIES